MKRGPTTFLSALTFLCSSILAHQTPRPPGGGLAERFKQLDRDGDGKLTREETPQTMPFDQWDANMPTRQRSVHHMLTGRHTIAVAAIVLLQAPIRSGPGTEDYARGVGCDGAGNVYVTGVFSGEVSFGRECWRAGGAENLFQIKLTPPGEVVWARGMIGPGVGHGCEIEVTSDGPTILSGDVMGALTVGAETIRSTGRRDTFVACLDREGNVDWVKPIRARGTAANCAVAFDPAGRITVVGSYTGTLECDGRRLVPGSSMESFVITLDKMPSQSEAISR